MPKLPRKATKAVTEEVDDAPDNVEDVVTMDGEDNPDFVPAVPTDPYSFVYEVQAGKKFTGFSFPDAMNFVGSLMGKVDKIVITKVK